MMVILAMKEGPAEVLQLVLVYLGSEVLVSCLGLSVLAVSVEQLVGHNLAVCLVGVEHN